MATLEKNTIRLEHMQGQQLIDAFQDQVEEGTIYTVVIQVEKTVKKNIPIENTDIHPLAKYFLENHPFNGLSEKMVSAKREIRDSMGEKMAGHFDK